jgi:hypothetical protein
MDSKKTPKKRSLNHYRQVKDVVYKSRQLNSESARCDLGAEFKSKNKSYIRLLEDLKDLCRSHGNDQELGGAVRRLIKKHYEVK